MDNNLYNEIKSGIEEYFFDPIETEEEASSNEEASYVYCPDMYDAYYQGNNGFFYEESDYEELFPVSSSVASIRSGFLDQSWGTPITPMGWYRGLRYVSSFLEAAKIQKQYEEAIGRTSSYRGNLFGHIVSRHGLVYEPLTGNYLCGYEAYGAFIVSHFAPKNIFSGMRMIKKVALDQDFPVIIATLPYQANQLIKAGFKAVGQVPQWFDGEIHMKTVCVNAAVDVWDLQKIIETLAIQPRSYQSYECD